MLYPFFKAFFNKTVNFFINGKQTSSVFFAISLIAFRAGNIILILMNLQTALIMRIIHADISKINRLTVIRQTMNPLSSPVRINHLTSPLLRTICIKNVSRAAISANTTSCTKPDKRDGFFASRATRNISYIRHKTAPRHTDSKNVAA